MLNDYRNPRNTDLLLTNLTLRGFTKEDFAGLWTWNQRHDDNLMNTHWNYAKQMMASGGRYKEDSPNIILMHRMEKIWNWYQSGGFIDPTVFKILVKIAVYEIPNS